MTAIAPRAGPAGGIPVLAGIAVSIQIMALAISMCSAAGRPGRRVRPGPARPSSADHSAAQPNTAAWAHAAAAGSDRQVMAVRAAHITTQDTTGTGPAASAAP